MECGKWMSTLLFIISVALTASRLDDDEETIALSVWVGQVSDLQCGDNSPDPTRRLWKRGDEIWLFMNEVVTHNDRVSSINQSSILRIVNVTIDDEGYYTCTAFTRPHAHRRTLHLQVKEQPCEAPLKPLNGDYMSETDTYRTGDTIRYHCDRGYQLIGESNRTCTGTIKGWQPQEPHCQLECVGLFGQLMDKLSSIDNKVTGIEQRITIIENNTWEMSDKMSEIDNKVLANHNKSVDIKSRLSLFDVRRPTDGCSNVTAFVDQQEVFECMGQVGATHGDQGSVYEWVIKNYERKWPKSDDTYYSPPFYHTVPRFRLQLRIYRDNYLQFGAFLLRGEYDEELTWPVLVKHDLSIRKRDGGEALQSTWSLQMTSCNFTRTRSATLFGCYNNSDDEYRSYNTRMWRDFQINIKDYTLNDGSVVVKLHLFN